MKTRTKKMLKVGKVVGWSLLALLFLGFFGMAMTGIVSLPDTPDATSYVLGFGSVAFMMGLFGYLFYLEEHRGHDFRVASARQSSPQRTSSSADASIIRAAGMGLLAGAVVNHELHGIADTIAPMGTTYPGC